MCAPTASRRLTRSEIAPRASRAAGERAIENEVEVEELRDQQLEPEDHLRARARWREESVERAEADVGELVEARAVELVLAAEVMVDHADAHAGKLRDRGNRHAVEAVAREQLL